EYLVTVSVTDTDDGLPPSIATFTVLVRNAAPTATLTGPTTMTEGTTAEFYVTASDVAGDVLEYDWLFDYDGNPASFAVPQATGTAAAFRFGQDGEYVVAVRVRDEDGGETIVTHVVTVANVPPTVNLGPDRIAPEGAPIVFDALLDGLFTDPADGMDMPVTFRWSVISDNGQVIPPGDQGGFSFTPLNEGVYVVTLEVDDGGLDGVRTDQLQITVVNVLPQVTILGPSTVVEGPLTPVQFIAVITGDDTDTHVVAWNVISSNGQVVGNGSGDTFAFTPLNNGTYWITATVTDGADVTSQLHTLTVQNAAPQVTSLTAAPLASVGRPVQIAGQFVDPGADAWTATIEVAGYGRVPVLVDPVTRQISMDYIFSEARDYELRLTVYDNDGAASTAAVTTLTVAPAAVPLNVTGVVVNDAGNPNRSGVRSLTFTFDEPATLAGASSLKLFNHTTGQAIDLSTATLVGNGTTAVTWNLLELALPDGRYTAELAAGTVLGLERTHTFAFHKLTGDLDGDGLVNFNDYFAVREQFDKSGAAYRTGDADGDGLVNFNDYFSVRTAFDAVLAPVTFDFGDAPTAAQSGLAASYPTTLAANGAQHVVTGNTLRLGTTRDTENNGQPTAAANGDGADEDGIVMGDLALGTTVGVVVTANGVTTTAFLNAWIDFNRDGDWDDPGEQVFIDQPIVNGTNHLAIVVPSFAHEGMTFARFRLTQTVGYFYVGLAPDGEVEDYQLNIIS
ncbi:MAG: hypothetical protein KF861_07940, partial [Planctomycetaceae bacterium]|nr:hypothetical protein [Planctomycetaceae bacterium]